jgi:hypothetical protein
MIELIFRQTFDPCAAPLQAGQRAGLAFQMREHAYVRWSADYAPRMWAAEPPTNCREGAAVRSGQRNLILGLAFTVAPIGIVVTAPSAGADITDETGPQGDVGPQGLAGPQGPPGTPGGALASGRVVVFPGQAPNLILASGAKSVTHPGTGIFCVVLDDAIPAFKSVAVATLDHTNDATGPFEASSIEIARDTSNDCGNLNAIDVRTFSMTADVVGGNTQLLVRPEDSSFSFVVQ